MPKTITCQRCGRSDVQLLEATSWNPLAHDHKLEIFIEHHDRPNTNLPCPESAARHKPTTAPNVRTETPP